MHRTTHDTQVYSPFGGGYVAEKHGARFEMNEAENGASRGRWALALFAFLICASTAGAIATSDSARATLGMTGQNFQLKVPSAGWFEPAVY